MGTPDFEDNDDYATVGLLLVRISSLPRQVVAHQQIRRPALLHLSGPLCNSITAIYTVTPRLLARRHVSRSSIECYNQTVVRWPCSESIRKVILEIVGCREHTDARYVMQVCSCYVEASATLPVEASIRRPCKWALRSQEHSLWRP